MGTAYKNKLYMYHTPKISAQIDKQLEHFGKGFKNKCNQGKRSRKI